MNRNGHQLDRRMSAGEVKLFLSRCWTASAEFLHVRLDSSSILKDVFPGMLADIET